MIALNPNDFDAKVMNARKLVLVFFNADWCAPGTKTIPHIEKAPESLGDVLEVYAMDSDASGDTMSRLGIISIPAVVLFKDGRIVERILGYVPSEIISGMIERHLA